MNRILKSLAVVGAFQILTCLSASLLCQSVTADEPTKKSVAIKPPTLVNSAIYSNAFEQGELPDGLNLQMKEFEMPMQPVRVLGIDVNPDADWGVCFNEGGLWMMIPSKGMLVLMADWEHIRMAQDYLDKIKPTKPEHK
jgi:hypothetical protein